MLDGKLAAIFSIPFYNKIAHDTICRWDFFGIKDHLPA